MSIVYSLGVSPTISVIIPAYNAGKYLAEAIESVLTQTIPPMEIIVIDDGSTDNTAQVAQQFSDRIRYLRQENAGPAAARNAGIAAACGKWIAFLDSDDRWFPYKLEQQIRTLTAEDSEALYCGMTVAFHGEVAPAPPPIQNEKITRLSFAGLLQRNRVSTSTVIAPRQRLLGIGGFRTQLRGPEDYDLWLRLAASGLPLRKSAVCLSAYRIVPQSLSQQVEQMRNQELLIVNQFQTERRLACRARAGVHLRAAIMFAGCQSADMGLAELNKSWSAWHWSLPEYSQGTCFCRLRLWRRLRQIRHQIITTTRS